MRVCHTLSRCLIAPLALGLVWVAVPATAPAGTISAATPRWLVADARARTAHLTLIASWGSANGGLNFDGYSNGRMVVTVPLGWKVQITFSNQSDAPHSAAVVAYQNPVPETGFKPAFKNAQSPHPLDGITQQDLSLIHI